MADRSRCMLLHHCPESGPVALYRKSSCHYRRQYVFFRNQSAGSDFHGTLPDIQSSCIAVYRQTFADPAADYLKCRQLFHIQFRHLYRFLHDPECFRNKHA